MPKDRGALDEVPETVALMTPGEVARLFRVDPKTVGRWAKAGRLPCYRTVGGHRRFRVDHVRLLLDLDYGDPGPLATLDA